MRTRPEGLGESVGCMFDTASVATRNSRGQLKCGRNGNLMYPSVLVAYYHNNSVFFCNLFLSNMNNGKTRLINGQN